MWHDIVYAFRPPRRQPGLTAMAVLALAIAVGANTAIFSVVNAVLLRPLPFHDPDRLVFLWEANPIIGGALSPPLPALPIKNPQSQTPGRAFLCIATHSARPDTLPRPAQPTHHH